MRPGGGKRKGSGFEREICRVLSLFWSKGTRRDLCWRSSNSGGTATVSRGGMSKMFFGDISPIDPDIAPLFDVFCFELKRHRKISIDDLFSKKKNVSLLDFWKQAADAAAKSNRRPILIYKANKCQEMIVMQRDVASFFVSSIDEQPQTLPCISYKNNFKNDYDDYLFFFRMVDLLSVINISKFKDKISGLISDSKLATVLREPKTEAA